MLAVNEGSLSFFVIAVELLSVFLFFWILYFVVRIGVAHGIADAGSSDPSIQSSAFRFEVRGRLPSSQAKVSIVLDAANARHAKAIATVKGIKVDAVELAEPGREPTGVVAQ